MYVYLSPTVEEAAQSHGLTRRINHLKDQIERDSSLFDLLFSSRFPLWVRRIRHNLRLVATLKVYGEDKVLCLADILPRGGDEYRAFLDNPELWEQKHVNCRPLEDYLKQRKQVSPIADRPMPEKLYPWLDRPILMHRESKETIVFESELWVSRFQTSQSRFAPYLELIYGIVSHLLFGTETHSSRTVALPGPAEHPRYVIQTAFPHYDVYQCIDSETNYCVLFSRIRPVDAPQREILFLLDIFDHRPKQAEVGNVGNQLKLFGSQAANCKPLSQFTANELARYVKRSYPDYIASYLEHWQALELEPNVNLALSGEEEALLHTMMFPAFINGRAGSGKSTMLHYAFAYYCELYLRELVDPTESNDQVRPLFLTYSDRLTDKARETVRRILSSHAYYIGRGTFTKSQLEALNDCFQTFQPFLIFLLRNLPEHQRQNFEQSRYISFHGFKQRYLRAFPRQDFSAEECWHTIRTYIKGYYFVDSSDESQEYLSIEEYETEINQSDKKISDESFQKIHHTVWRWYRKLCQEERLWDDQDLSRAVLEEIAAGNLSLAHYAAIFCDEAQDFTRIEFQLILRLSIWTQYRLPIVIQSLPFAFAGDPMQTLNPTGFSWDSFRASFYEKVLTPLDPDGLRQLNAKRLALRELHQNYRSPAAVVRFTNWVHLWRRTLFNIKTLEPQEPWWTEGGSQPLKGILDTNLTQQELRRLADSGAIFLLPCDEGGQIDFLHRHPILRELFPCEGNQVPPNIYTPVGMKGLELSPIVVCWFGDYYAQHLTQTPLRSLTQADCNLELEYFLNKLYVAVSRSTNQLTIVDTQRGDRLLWQEISAHHIDHWLPRMPLTLEQQQEQTAYLNRWKMNLNCSLHTINMNGINQVDFRFNGKQCLLSGIENRDIHNLETAIFYYEKAGLVEEVNYCRAWILRLQNNPQAAGRAFMAIPALSDGDHSPQRDAWQCFWEGQCWSDLLEWIGRNRTEPQVVCHPMVQFMVQFMVQPVEDSSSLIGLSEFSTFLTQGQDTSWHRIHQDPTWKAAIDRYCQSITRVLNHPSRYSLSDWILWSQTLDTIMQAGYTTADTAYLAGQCCYQVGNLSIAIDLWEQYQHITHREYLIAKAKTLPAVDGVPWFARAGLHEQVVKLWEESDRPLFGAWAANLPVIREALRQTQHVADLLDLEIQTRQWVAAAELCQHPKIASTGAMRVVEAMAHDASLTPETARKHREVLSRFVTQTTEATAWQASESHILAACVAIEKLGVYRSALPLFERFMDSPHTPGALHTFIRERWLVVKGKQAEFQEGQGRLKAALRQRQEREANAQDWNIDLQQLSPEVPTLPLSFLRLEAEEAATSAPVQAPVSGGSLRSEQRQEPAQEPLEHQLRTEIYHALQELTGPELHQVNQYIRFLQYLRHH